ncbi:MAG TPA: Uma2 family endonuclease [Gemmataceae bacterium]|nr:Uma2 family endonuclease [Gemmataceae bacterium]
MNLIPPPLDVEMLWQRTLDSEHRFEWVDGRLKEKALMGSKANRIATILARLLDTHAATHRLGWGFTGGCGYQSFPHEARRVRYPDLSFVARGRLPDDQIPDGHMRVAPDLEVEVVSPNELAEETEARVADYLAVGVKLLWIIYPSTRSIWILHRDGTAIRLTEAQELSGEDVVPGFTCPIRTLFTDL